MTPPFSIRRATVPDAAALAALATDTFRESFEDANAAEDMAAYLAANFSESIQRAELSDPRVSCFVATDGGGLIGYCLLRAVEPEACVSDRGAIELNRLYVRRTWLGKGVGEALMRIALEEARRRGHATIWLGVWEHNPRALAFYRRHAFREVGGHDFMLGSDRQTDLVMERAVEAAPPLASAPRAER
jgi:ribosomal protein S18 acetylase RimI-like enzyme